MFNSSIALIALGFVYLFFPGVAHAGLGWDFVARVSFVLLLGVVMLMWAHGYRANVLSTSATSRILELALPIFFLLAVYDSSSYYEMSLPAAMKIMGAALILCGSGFIYFYGIGLRKNSS